MKNLTPKALLTTSVTTITIAIFIVLLAKANHEYGTQRNGSNNTLNPKPAKSLQAQSPPSRRDRITPSTDKQFILDWQSIASTNATAVEKTMMLQKLAKAYVHSVGLEHASRNVIDNSGKGRSRNILLRMLYLFSNEDHSEIFRLSRTLADDETRDFALGGLYRNISIRGFDQDDLVKVFPNCEIENKAFCRFAVMLAQEDRTGEPSNRKAVQLGTIMELLAKAYPDPEARLRYTRMFLDEISDNLPIELIDNRSVLFRDHPEFMVDIVTSSLTLIMAGNPELGIEKAMEFNRESPNNIPSPVFENFISLYLRSDTAGAEAWLSENNGLLIPDHRDSARAAIALHHSGKENLKDAWRRAGEIENPEIRKSTEGTIWNKERDMVRTQVKEDPDHFMKNLTSGESNHQDYWLEEAVFIWIETDPEKADDWQRQMVPRLPPRQSQYVAAAYAKNALALGDAETASQWAAMIIDNKTKARIDALIKEARQP